MSEERKEFLKEQVLVGKLMMIVGVALFLSVAIPLVQLWIT
jgi:hypothetical protein